MESNCCNDNDTVDLDAGMVPESELILKSNSCNDGWVNMDAGMVPESELLPRYNFCNDGRVNRDDGMDPESELFVRSTNLRLG